MTVTLESPPATGPLAAPIAENRVQPEGPGERNDRRWVGVGIASGLAAVAGWAFTSGIAVPWPWSDEGATFLALQRNYAQLLVLYRGPDAPLVPYYLLAKAWTEGLQSLWPLMSTLVAVRLLSAAAAGLTVVVLYGLVSRNVGRLAGLASGLLLVSLPGFARLAQEARPYSLLALAATFSWLMWDRWLQPARRPHFWPAWPYEEPAEALEMRAAPAGAGYLLSLVTLGFVHTFGLFQWPAQLLATLLTRTGRPWHRWRTVGLTLGVLAAAGLLVAAQTVAALKHGTGSQSPLAARVVNVSTVVTQVLRGAFLSTAPLVIAPVLALVLVSLLGKRSARRFAVTTMVWLLVPLAMELGLSMFRTTLFRSRYWVADLPPLAAAAGLGFAVAAHALYTAISRAFAGRRAAGGWRRGVAVVAVTVLFAGIAGLQGTLQAHEQGHLRTLRGHHSEDLARILSIIDKTRATHPHLPVLISSGSASGILGAARPQLEADNPLRRLDPQVATVFTVPASQASVRARIHNSKLLLWVFRGPLTATGAAARIPHGLAGEHLRVVRAIPAGPRWTAVLLKPGPNVLSTTTTRRH